MGIVRFFRSVFNREILGEEIVSQQEKIYRLSGKIFPDADLHDRLVGLWISRMRARRKNIEEEEIEKMLARAQTALFACAPPPGSVRALGLYFIYKEHPDIILSCPKFGKEFEKLMMPVFVAKEKGSLEQLYRRYNPNSEWNQSWEGTAGAVALGPKFLNLIQKEIEILESTEPQ